MYKVNQCILCNNEINEYNFREGYTICQYCYAKYKTNLKKFIIVGEPKFKPVILDQEYFRKPFTEKLSEPLTYFTIQEQTGLDSEAWENIWQNIWSEGKPLKSSPTFSGQIRNVFKEPLVELIEEEPVKNYKRKIEL